MRRNRKKSKISQLMALLLCLMLFLPCVPVAQADSGSCGDSLNWSLDGNTLTISGSGAMTDYKEDRLPPWYSNRSQIYQLSLPEGLTSVGSMAFYDCVNLTAVNLPSSVTVVGDLAFCQNKNLIMLSLNTGLKSIGRSAFDRCESLVDLRIPGTVQSIGDNAFYMCTSLKYVTIPASVTSMGTGVFSYCDSLVRADVNATVDAIPFWTFYGCDNLNSATFGGDAVNPDQLKTEQRGTGQGNQSSVNNTQNNTAESLDIQQNGDDQYQVSDSVTTMTESTTITKTDILTGGEAGGVESSDTNYTATIVNPNGWDEVVEQVQPGQTTNTDETTDVTIYLPDDSTVPGEVLQELAGSNADLTINTSSGTKFKIDCAQLDAETIDGDLDLSYSIVLLDTVPEGIDSSAAYQLIFNNSCGIKVEVMIRLPLENTRHAASLYQLGNEDTYEYLQSVIVDNDGYAHYYLSAIDQETEYLIAMDVQGEQSAQAIIPENLYDEYRLVDHSTGKQYVITGRKSSWNMGLGKVMAILAVVMVSAIVVVGAVVFFWNKQRLKAGYVPQWDDEDEI